MSTVIQNFSILKVRWLKSEGGSVMKYEDLFKSSSTTRSPLADNRTERENGKETQTEGERVADWIRSFVFLRQNSPQPSDVAALPSLNGASISYLERCGSDLSTDTTFPSTFPAPTFWILIETVLISPSPPSKCACPLWEWRRFRKQ
jgi:hypothetical protein